jgi:hypothetical protein
MTTSTGQADDADQADDTEDAALFVGLKRWIEHLVRYGRETAGKAPRMPRFLDELPDAERSAWIRQETQRAEAEHAAHRTPERTWRHRLWG